jgi:hypothetical protein
MRFVLLALMSVQKMGGAWVMKMDDVYFSSIFMQIKSIFPLSLVDVLYYSRRYKNYLFLLFF